MSVWGRSCFNMAQSQIYKKCLVESMSLWLNGSKSKNCCKPWNQKSISSAYYLMFMIDLYLLAESLMHNILSVWNTCTTIINTHMLIAVKKILLNVCLCQWGVRPVDTASERRRTGKTGRCFGPTAPCLWTELRTWNVTRYSPALANNPTIILKD